MRFILQAITFWMGILSVIISTNTLCADEIDQYVEQERTRQQIPGLALLIVRDSRVEKAQGYGLANVEQQSPVTADTVFQSASMGKQFTAVAVMMLVEDGKLTLDDRVSRILPEAPAAWDEMTVRHLLSHTSGLGDYPSGFDMRRDRTEEEIIAEVYGTELTFSPGTDWRYSNLGYVTLGAIIRRVSGKFYGDLLRERVFQPLGMRSTRNISEEAIIPRRAAGYRLVEGELRNQEWVAPTLNTTADGSLYFSIADFARWDQALRSGKLLKKDSLRTMWTVTPLNNGQPNSGNYGLGWFCDTLNGRPVVRHSGEWQGFHTCADYYLETPLTVAVFANLSRANTEEIALQVARMVSQLDAKP